MNLAAEYLPPPTPALPLAAAGLPRERPRDEPQSLVLAVELGLLAQRWRRRWPELRLSLPRGGTWPLHSWPQALHEALDELLDTAVEWQQDAAIVLEPRLERGLLRLDLGGTDEQARRWLPRALRAAQRLAAWQGGRLLWRAGGERWKVRLSLPLSPARR
ncbi:MULTISPECIES: hypothetical protein [Pseudomonas]|uniref:Uncharacterized protein n=2 Tax=Pseudomonas TaxID=286 RepID=A0AAW6P969_9PSED|nr:MULTISPECIES: hypothetical protein [Pseudomonas]KES25738.1 hypothetical protein FG99_06410 [Pseudomonas sp. AAC]MBH3433547.1 hypothetical protein [Pseudomonas citronellolis]MDF3844065.1 hypothetical protein [Pseudomonas citronellolis]